MKKYYKCIKSVPIGTNYITENSIIVYQELKKANGSKKIEIFAQGSDSKLNISNFNELFSKNIIIELPESTELLEYVNSYVIEPQEFSDRKKMLNSAKRDLPEFANVISTISTWIFSTKGSSAVTLQAEKSFIKNAETFLTETVFRGGMKAKPGSPFKNRGTRQSTVSDVAKWENDETTLLPNGIRKSDSCTYQMQCKIFDKILTDVLSIHDVPEKFYNYFVARGYKSRERKHVDYYYKTLISWEFFKQNTHHSKIKGLEFCHLNPELEYSTQVDNVTIGTSESNRHQGGYSIDKTFKKILISKIYELSSNDDNYTTLAADLNNMSEDELLFKLTELKK